MNRRMVAETVSFRGICFLLLVFTLFSCDKKPTGNMRLGNSNIWYQNVIGFYSEAAVHMINAAKSHHHETIVLLPIENRSDYHFSMPSNAGLTRTILEINSGIDVVFWKGDIPSVQGWIGAFFIDGERAGEKRALISPRGGWYRLKCNDQGEWEEEKAERPDKSYDTRIIVDRITIDKENHQVEADILIEDSDGIIKTDMHESTTYQIRWFLDKKFLADKGIVFVVLLLGLLGLFIYFGWLSFRILFDPGALFNPELELLCLCLAGALIFFLMNINPYHREEGSFYEPINLMFLIDNNSEVFFDPGERDVIGFPTIIRNICEKILNLDRFKPDMSNPVNHLWAWITERLPRLIMTRQRYELNDKAGYIVHRVSGAGREYGGYRSISSIAEASRNISESIVYDHMRREPRLIIPEEEFTWIRENQQIDARKIKYTLFFSSACAPHREDVASFNSKINTDRSLKVFSVFLPTLPRTGFREPYNYEDRKIEFLNMVSDYTVMLNDNGSNIGQAKTVPLYTHNDLGIHSAQVWDEPRDLDKERRQKFHLDMNNSKDKERLDKSIQDISGLFNNFIDQYEPVLATNKKFSVHVLAKNSPHLIISGLLLILIGTVIFSYHRYSSQWLGRWQYVGPFKKKEYACLILSGPIMLGILFLSIYGGDNPQNTSALGYTNLAFWGTIISWFFFYIFPHLILILYWTPGKFGQTLKWYAALGMALGMIFIFVFGAIVSIRFFTYIIKSQFWLAAAVFASVLLSLFMFPLASILKNKIPFPDKMMQLQNIPPNAAGAVPQWQLPIYSMGLKLLFWFAMLTPVCGYLAADPSGTRLAYPLNVYYWLLTIAGILLLIFLSIIIAAIERLFYKNL